MMHQNPQQDDSEPSAIGTTTLPMSSNMQMYYQTSTHKEIPLSMTKGVTSKNRRDKYMRQNDKKKNQEQQEFDPLMFSKSVKINFLIFMMFFNDLT